MTWQNSAITIATFLPIAGALLILMIPKDREKTIRIAGIVVTGVAMLAALLILPSFRFGQDAGLQFELNVPWINAIGARYHVGIDGISLPLFQLTFILSFLCAIYTYRYVPDPGKTKAFLALILLLETGMAGTFIAFDLVLFFVFWELVLVPMYFLIGVWGSSNRQYASMKFFLYTLFGSVFMLLAFLALYFASTPHTFDIQVLTEMGGAGAFARTFQMIAFAGIFIGFAIKVPMAVPHVAAGCAHGSADRRLGVAGWCALEDGDLRVRADRTADPARRGSRVGAGHRHLGGHRDHLCLFSVSGAEGSEAIDCVLLGRSHGIRAAWNRDAHRHWDQRRHLRDGRARADHWHAVLLRWVDLRPLSHA